MVAVKLSCPQGAMHGEGLLNKRSNTRVFSSRSIGLKSKTLRMSAVEYRMLNPSLCDWLKCIPVFVSLEGSHGRIHSSPSAERLED